MSEESSSERPAPAGGQQGAESEPRLGPRPLDRPPVDAGQASVFGRPDGVASAFDPGRPSGHEPANGALRLSAPPPEALATAFGRPSHSPDVILQRAPGSQPDDEDADRPGYWDGSELRNPWRDPGAGAALGPPAVTGTAADEATTGRRAGPLLSVPELLFGRRVKPSALLVLFACALLVGAIGGVAGWAISSGADRLTDVGASIAAVDPGRERAPNSVAGVASRVSPAVVSLEVEQGNAGDVGSGVVIDPKGYILTNNHVISVAAQGAGGQITAVFSSGARVSASIVGRDPVTDLAVLKVNATHLTVLQPGTSTNVNPSRGMAGMPSRSRWIA